MGVHISVMKYESCRMNTGKVKAKEIWCWAWRAVCNCLWAWIQQKRSWIRFLRLWDRFHSPPAAQSLCEEHQPCNTMVESKAVFTQKEALGTWSKVQRSFSLPSDGGDSPLLNLCNNLYMTCPFSQSLFRQVYLHLCGCLLTRIPWYKFHKICLDRLGFSFSEYNFHSMSKLHERLGTYWHV